MPKREAISLTRLRVIVIQTGLGNVAKLSGVSRSALSRWTRGEADINITRFLDVAQAVGYSVRISPK